MSPFDCANKNRAGVGNASPVQGGKQRRQALSVSALAATAHQSQRGKAQAEDGHSARFRNGIAATATASAATAIAVTATTCGKVNRKEGFRSALNIVNRCGQADSIVGRTEGAAGTGDLIRGQLKHEAGIADATVGCIQRQSSERIGREQGLPPLGPKMRSERSVSVRVLALAGSFGLNTMRNEDGLVTPRLPRVGVPDCEAPFGTSPVVALVVPFQVTLPVSVVELAGLFSVSTVLTAPRPVPWKSPGPARTSAWLEEAAAAKPMAASVCVSRKVSLVMKYYLEKNWVSEQVLLPF
jgi:hypothetical protein